MNRRSTTAAALLTVLLAAGSAGAQNLITQGGWQGFATRDAENKFDGCVL